MSRQGDGSGKGTVLVVLKNRHGGFLGILLDSKAKEKKECQDVRSLATRDSREAGLRKWLPR